MGVRDRIAKVLMGRPAPPVDAVRALRDNAMNPAAATRDVYKSMGDDMEYSARFRQGDVPMVATEKMWRPATPTDADWVKGSVQGYDDALEFLKGSQSIDRYGVR